VFIGKFRLPGYQDGDVIRHLVDGEVIARRNRRGWNHKVMAVKALKGPYDNIKPLNTEAVVVHLDKGQYY